MELVSHNCKYCGAQVTLKFATGAMVVFAIEKWKSLAACDRCADFLEKRRTARHSIEKVAVNWLRAKTATEKENCREQLETLLRDWVEIMNTFFRTAIPWDSSVVESLTKTADRIPVGAVLNQCERMMRQQTPTAALRVGRAQFPIQ